MRLSHTVHVDALNEAIAEYLIAFGDDERDEYEMFATDRQYSEWFLGRFVEWLTLSRKEWTRITSVIVGATWTPGTWDVYVKRRNHRNPRMYKVGQTARDRLEKALSNEGLYTMSRPHQPTARSGFTAHLKQEKDTP
jgi:hypothetical protein